MVSEISDASDMYRPVSVFQSASVQHLQSKDMLLCEAHRQGVLWFSCSMNEVR